MKKLILSGGILALLMTAFALMSMKAPSHKADAAAKKFTTINFLLQNTSRVDVSWTFRLGSVQEATGVLAPGHNQTVPLPSGSYEVILNDADSPPTSFHMEFNTGENAFAPGHTFFGIDIDTGHSTSLDFF